MIMERFLPFKDFREEAFGAFTVPSGEALVLSDGCVLPEGAVAEGSVIVGSVMEESAAGSFMVSCHGSEGITGVSGFT